MIIFVIKLFGRFARGRLLSPARSRECIVKTAMEAFNSCHPHAKTIVEKAVVFFVVRARPCFRCVVFRVPKNETENK